jgi:putative ABC transport system permease protein
VRVATPGYLEALRIPLKRGRLLTAQDAERSAPVAIITEESARRYWPGEDPVGKRIRIHVSMGTREPQREIVGVVGDVRTRALDEAAPPVVYVPHAQYPSDQMTVFVRTTGDPLAMLPVVKSQLAIIDRDIALTRVRTGTELVAASIAQPRFRMLLLGLFAAMALALAAVGLYGVMAFSVGQRRTELAMRMALGADASSLLFLVLRQGLTPVAIGLALGLPAAALLTRVMSGLVYQIDTFDPITFAAVAMLLAAVAAAACYLPARRAIALDPLRAIRQE